VVLCHGFRGIKEWLLPSVARAFADRGFTALTFDYRGMGESEGSRDYMALCNQVVDIRNVLTFLVSQSTVGPGRLMLYGTSPGGANAVQAAALDERVKMVVCQAGIGDVTRAWRESKERLAARMAADREQRVHSGASATIDGSEILGSQQSKEAVCSAEERFPLRDIRISLRRAGC
jgi:dienelactone hydrolase